MSFFKLSFILPLAACAGLLAWWLMPHYTHEEEAYYVSVFCAIRHDDSQRFQSDMQAVIEGSNSDYALQKIHYLPDLGEKVFSIWEQLAPEEKAAVFRTPDGCRQLMGERISR
ncbi:hypothetical protein [[Erwinia] mediterraneensis]|uniref:hypothetical protein n=1 Tax=[Erwinia] mediterraneensis TaxID=2161819 RepID=UPI0010305C57|nr:hypothetical protein [[Erwinia] mediterraneensis]